MAFDISKNHRDKDAENNGTWMEYDDEVSFLVARKNTHAYQSFIAKKYRANERLMSGSDVLTEKAKALSDQIMIEALANYVLKDWKGVESNGKPYDYTPGRGMAFLEEYDDIRDMIDDYASNRDNYLVEKQLADEGNLKKSSNGK